MHLVLLVHVCMHKLLFTFCSHLAGKCNLFSLLWIWNFAKFVYILHLDVFFLFKGSLFCLFQIWFTNFSLNMYVCCPGNTDSVLSILIMHFDFAFTIFLFLRLRLWIDIGHLKSSSIYHNKNASTYHAICSLSVKLSTSHVLLLITELLRKFKVIQNVEKHIKIEQQEERTDISHVDQNHSYNSTDSPPQQIIHLSPWQTPLAIRAPFKIKHNLITKTCQITSIHF